MNDEEICQVLNQVCQNPSLFFQTSQQPPYLYIFINRSPELKPNYEALTHLLGETIAELGLPHFTYVALYSRILGQMDHDWQTCINISDFVHETLVVTSTEIEAERTRILQEITAKKQAELSEAISLSHGEEITEFVEHRARQPFSDDEPTLIRDPAADSLHSAPSVAANSLPSDQQLTIDISLESTPEISREDFSHYCFISDPEIWTIDPQDISPNIAKALAIFHRFPTRGKHRVLPLLGQIFQGDRGVVFIHFPEQVQSWFEHILRFNSEEMQQAAVWFSRYCQGPRQTLRKVQDLMQHLEPSPQQHSLEAAAIGNPELTSDHCANLGTSGNTLDHTPKAPINAHAVVPETAWTKTTSLGSSLHFLLLGVGSLILGGIGAGLSHGKGTGSILIALIPGLVLETISTTTSNRALRQFEGGILALCIILQKIIPSSGFAGGYFAGCLLGLGSGYILRSQWMQIRQPFPQNMSDLLICLSDRKTLITFGIAVGTFSLPLLLIR